MSAKVRELWCLIEGDSAAFEVIVPVDANIGRLKRLVWDYGCTTGLAKDLVLWKLILPEPISPSKGLAERIASRGDLSKYAVELEEPSDKVLDKFPEHPCTNHIHVIVQVPPAEDYPPHKRPRLLSPPHEPSSRSVPRSDTVSALYQKLNKYQFILVRGTPASGKTTLARLLSWYISQQEPGTNVIWIQSWSREEVNSKGRWQHYFEKEKGWVIDDKTVFVFDEAQMSYDDSDLWNNFFKDIHNYNCRAIAFMSYGSASSRFSIAGTPIAVNDVQRVTLRPIQHEDHLPPVGLFFTRTEFNDLVSKLYPSPEYQFDTSFFEHIFDLTLGHVGAIYDFMRIIIAHDSYRTIRNDASQSYTWDSFLEHISPRTLVKALETSASIFIRGLPLVIRLRDPSIAHIFSSVLSNGAIIIDVELAIEGALLTCFRNGWLHSDKLDNIGQPEKIGYSFASPLHRWYVEWKLQDTLPEKPLNIANILDLVIGVVAKFSPRKLSTERRISSGLIQRPPEAQYQDEFYRCCHSCSDGSLLTFPEYGTAKGRVDFYIPTEEWGVELLRDGDRLAQHSARFSPAGSYASLPLSDYIILDCRTSKPTVAHPDLQKLYHVVFSDNFNYVRILDNKLNSVPGGEFPLLPSS